MRKDLKQMGEQFFPALLLRKARNHGRDCKEENFLTQQSTESFLSLFCLQFIAKYVYIVCVLVVLAVIDDQASVAAAAAAAAVPLPSTVGLKLGTIIDCNYSALMTPILESDDYILSLEVAPPRITIRQMYSTSSPSSYPLMWVANYYNQSVLLDTSHAAGTANSTTTSCSLQFTSDGDLQLLLVSGNTNTTAGTAPQKQMLLWNSGTAGMGVQLMNLTTFGNLVLLDAQNNSIWQSFDHPNSQILYSQQFRYYCEAYSYLISCNSF
jgi:hypothetical protein